MAAARGTGRMKNNPYDDKVEDKNGLTQYDRNSHKQEQHKKNVAARATAQSSGEAIKPRKP